MAIVGIAVQDGVERIVAVGRYYLDRSTNSAEVSLVVDDRYQSRGVGTFLLGYLGKIAKERGVAALTGVVRAGNVRMLRLLQRAGFKLESSVLEGTYLATAKL